MKFNVNGRELESYELSNKELLELFRKSDSTEAEKDYLDSKIIERFAYDLCPKAGENEDDVFVRFFSNFVNGKMRNKEYVANRMANEHRYLQEEMFKVCMAYIAKLATSYESGRYDARNAYACETSYKIIKALNEMKAIY